MKRKWKRTTITVPTAASLFWKHLNV